MKPFTDSSDILMDGAALNERVSRDGYLFIRNLLPTDIVTELRRQSLEIAANARWVRTDRPLMDAVADPGRACADPEAPYVSVLKDIYRLESLHALKHHPAIVGLFERLFGEPVLVHPMVIPRNIFPERPELTTPPHQDFVHIQGTAECYAVWITLSDCPVEMGGLQIAEASHTQGVHEFKVSSGAGAMEVADPMDGRWVGGDYALGDVVIFHSMAVHRGAPNLSERLRQSIDARYQKASDPIVETSLTPYAGMGDWDDIYTNWESDALKYYWHAQNPTLAEFDRQYYEERDRMAFDMARTGDQEARAALLRIVQRDPDPDKRATAQALVSRLDSALPAAE